MKLQITVTKEHLRKSMGCVGIDTTNCAIAVAVRDIFPEASIGGTIMYAMPLTEVINLPQEATKFISQFDLLVTTPEKRLDLPELIFTIVLPDYLIDQIDISELDKVEHLRLIPSLEKTENLKLVTI